MRCTLLLAPLTLGLVSSVVQAQCPSDDHREDNDGCSSAVPAVPGTQFGLAVAAGDDDYFRIRVEAGEQLDVLARFEHASGDIDLYLYDAASSCMSLPLVAAASMDDDEAISYVNSGTLPLEVVLHVALLSGTCNDYDLLIGLPVGLQGCGAVDVFEPNNSIADATPLQPGAQTRLSESLMGGGDFYSYVVPPASTITVRTFEFAIDPNDTAGLVLYNFDGSQTLAFDFAPGSNAQEVTWDNDTGAPALVNAQFVFQVGVSACVEYSVNALVDAIDCPGADRFEPNDVCTAAAPIAAGLVEDLTAERTNRDYYSVQVPAGGSIVVDSMQASVAATDVVLLELRSADCSAVLDSDFGVGSGMQSVAWSNVTGMAEEVRVFFDFSAGTSACLDYVLDVQVDACGATPDDGLEDNDTCGTAAALPLGTTVGLWVFGDDPDFYALQMDNRTQLDASLAFDPAAGPVDLALFRGTACAPGDLVALGMSTATGAALRYTNDVGMGDTFVLAVRYGGAMSGCATYDLSATTTPGMLGSYVCMGVANSTGVGAHMTATGSDAVVDNALTLGCDDLPNFSAGFFLNSLEMNLVPNPGGSVGNLCIGGIAVGRHDDDILFSGSSGEISLALDLTDVPRPTGPVSIVAGQTWYWQYWYRDVDPSGAAVSNLSDALGIAFL